MVGALFAGKIADKVGGRRIDDESTVFLIAGLSVLALLSFYPRCRRPRQPTAAG